MELLARNLKQVGAAVRRMRRRAGLTQSQLAAGANVRQATISTLERGESGANLQTVLDVLGVLGLELVVRERTVSVDRIEDQY